MKNKTLYFLASIGLACALAVCFRLDSTHPAQAVEAPLQVKGGGLWPYLRFTTPTSSGIKLPLQSNELSLSENFQGQLAYCVRFKRGDKADKYSTVTHLISKSANSEVIKTSVESVAVETKDGGDVSTYITDPQFSSSGRLIMLGLRQDYDVNNILFSNSMNLDFHGLTAIEDEEDISPPTQSKVAWSDDETHIAYFTPETYENGSYADEFQLVSAKRTIFVQDWHKKTRAGAVQAQGIIAPLAWQKDRLLFGALPFEDKQSKYSNYDANINNKEYFLPRPNIYAYSVVDKKTTLLIKDGYRPSVSPDDKLIAFYGSSNPQTPVTLKRDESPGWYWRYIAKGASLCFANADGSGRTAMQPYYGLYPRIQWLPDSRRFVTIAQTKRNPDFEAQLTLWDTQTQSKKELGTIKVSDDKKQTENDAYAPLRFPFYPMGATLDGKHIVIKTVSHQYASSDVIESLQTVNVETGEASTMATIKNATGIAWTPHTK